MFYLTTYSTHCSFQPVLHDWCNKGCGMCFPVWVMVHIKEPLLLIRKSSPCGCSGFPLSLSEWSFTIYHSTHLYLWLYGVKHMVKDHSDSERGNPLPPHGILFPISSKGSFICTIPQTEYHIPQPLLHQLWNSGRNEKQINECVCVCVCVCIYITWRSDTSIITKLHLYFTLLIWHVKFGITAFCSRSVSCMYF